METYPFSFELIYLNLCNSNLFFKTICVLLEDISDY